MSPYCGNFKNLELVYKMAYCDFEMLRKQTLIDRDDYPLWHWQDIRGVWRLVQIACNYSTSAEPIIVKRCIGVLAWLDRQIAALEAR